MHKTILITGATDGIGLLAAQRLHAQGHRVLLHGRSPAKLEAARQTLTSPTEAGDAADYLADLSRLGEVAALADAVADAHDHLDVLINNAGVFRTSAPITPDGLDVRFVVNTIAPYLLTRRLLPLLGPSGRVINVSSAAQSPVDPGALTGQIQLSEGPAYAQSKLAITAWSRQMALDLGVDGPAIVAVNPGSMLGSKMVKEAFGVAGRDLGVGAEILARAALEDAFGEASGQYFDNDAGGFGPPHPDASDPDAAATIVRTIEAILADALPQG